ncbi:MULTISPECIES: NAD(P)/FAD-dependent oxidoreductase [Streptomyces]|uniref:NAD(P)/FAD-dependent oxidoreductase n=1 Tax=Streptomyces TaxID=1883 RepID=UPI0009983509|nr:FAD-dependent oxidoreductase [Streptomyces peucetius]
MRTVTVVGASLAGLYAARALRAEGFDGRLVIVGAERHRPYDRPPLSKSFLTQRPPIAMELEDLRLCDGDEEDSLAAEWHLGSRATALDTVGRTVTLDDSGTVRALRTDGVVIATGAVPRTLPGPPLAGVHVLRTYDDAYALRTALHDGTPRVVVIGGGFIGAEAASSCAALGLPVTVVEAAPLPLVPQIGTELARICADLHADHGVRLLCGTGVAGLRDDGTGRVRAVELADGRLLDADVVIVGIGVRPATDWLAGSGLRLDDGVVCDAGGVTDVPQVVAAGDVARCAGTRTEHWTSATEQPATAVRNLLAGRTVARHQALPYFWSDQYGARLQLAGRPGPQDAVRIIEGDPGDRSFLAVHERDGHTTAVFAVDQPRPFMRLRRRLATDPPGPHGLSGPPAEPAGAPGAAFWPCCSAASAHRCAAPTPGA